MQYCPRCGSVMVAEDVWDGPNINPHVVGGARYICPFCTSTAVDRIPRPATNEITENELKRVLQAFFRDIPLFDYQVKLILQKAKSMGFDVAAMTRPVPKKEVEDAMKGIKADTIIIDEAMSEALIRDERRRRGKPLD